ncbi:MAG TPA: PhzF family phenazine biosynthesis protein [Bryobacteraceae bacterium]|nr:PhzF family phenazine biosynthesis protein [Bryobacteraceae bacterium]
MKIPLYQVDAFTDKRFHGNPAAICPLDHWLPDAVMQSIAAENNLSETAFYVRGNGHGAQEHRAGEQMELRWFTPAVEVDLCGHATLATALVVLDIRKEVPGSHVEFKTKSGTLVVERDGDRYAMDFPARPPAPCEAHPELVAGLGAQPVEILAARDYLCVYPSEADVRALTPDMARLSNIDRFATIATAPGANCDFVSRFFAPSKGVPEDPVTGSAHCTLIPYWAKRLGKDWMFARQVSQRSGELWCEMRGERVRIAGHGVLYLEGAIEVETGNGARH